MKRIPLTKGFFALVDDDDFDRVSSRSWSALVTQHGHVYAVSCKSEHGRTRTSLLHRLIMEAPRGVQVDHRSGDTLDNRRANLRFATHAQNVRNSKKPKTNSSGFKGVGWLSARSKPYRAVIYVDSKQIYLGNFSDKLSAAKAYDAAAIRYFGEFARLNFPIS